MSDGILVVPHNRVVERKQGCWNCKHHANIHTDPGRVNDRLYTLRTELNAQLRASKLHQWNRIVADPEALETINKLTKRGVDRKTATETVVRDRIGHDARQGFIDKVAADVKSGKMGICQRPGGAVHDAGVAEDPSNSAFIYSAFLCSGWTGVQGASVTRSTDEADLLPAELTAKVDAETPDVKK